MASTEKSKKKIPKLKRTSLDNSQREAFLIQALEKETIFKAPGWGNLTSG